VVLSLLAYQQKGWLGVGIFIGLTFVLHKIESYYLSPRLTARHVKIPGFLLIVSLIACEHLFGFTGFFLSFPILFVAGRIRTEIIDEDARAADPIATPVPKAAEVSAALVLPLEPCSSRSRRATLSRKTTPSRSPSTT